MTTLIYKYQAGKKVYLSITGKWIKSTATAWVLPTEEAKAKALELGACTRIKSYRD